MYGRWVGTLVALLGYHVGGLAGLFAGRYVVDSCVQGILNKSRKLRVPFKLIQRQPKTFLMICRVSPFLPYAPTNYIFGLTDLWWHLFVLVSVPASLPMVFTQASAHRTSAV